MLPTRIAALAAILLALTVVKVEARQTIIICNQQGCSDHVLKGQEGVKTSSRLHSPRKIAKPSKKVLEQAPIASGTGVIRSNKTGATARVSPAQAHKFQAYINDLEAHGAVIKFMGGIRPGPCWSGGLHPCGKALDVCQYARGVVDRRCNLPGKTVMAQIARANGLFEGGQWCHGDLGHAQVGVTAGACGSNIYSAVRKFKRIKLAKVH